MNIFIKLLKDNNLIGSFIKDDDINFLSFFENIIVEEKISKQGKINKKPYFNWFFIDNDNNKFALNLSRTDLKYNNHKLKTYCKTCGKFLGLKKISEIFEMKYSNINNLKICCHLECKNCSSKNNAIIGQEKSKKTCLDRYGVEFSFQSENNKRKSIETKIKKYGENWKDVLVNLQWGPSKRDVNGRLFYHNGYDKETRKKMVENWKKTVSKKPLEELRKWREKIISKTTSKICTEFLDKLSNSLNIKIEREYMIRNKIY